MKTLNSIGEDIRRCTSCHLWKKRLLAVPGEGPINSKLMFIGEAPGNEEDRLGLPFKGKSKIFFEQMLKLAQINRKKVFITNSVKCHPPNNRNPTVLELKTCKKLWLNDQINIIKPQLIILLGGVAFKSLFKKGKISEMHGKIIEKDEQKYFVTYHPSAGTRFPNIREKIESDFIKLKIIIGDF